MPIAVGAANDASPLRHGLMEYSGYTSVSPRTLFRRRHDTSASRYTAMVKRQIVAFLVILGLCFQAPAAFMVETPHCPMEGMVQAMAASGEVVVTDLPECCNDPATYDATGQACKSGAECNLAGAMANATALGTTLIQSGAQPPRTADSSVRAAPIPPPWRPPSLV